MLDMAIKQAVRQLIGGERDAGTRKKLMRPFHQIGIKVGNPDRANQALAVRPNQTVNPLPKPRASRHDRPMDLVQTDALDSKPFAGSS